MTSLSTRFLGQPRLTKPTFVGEAESAFLLVERNGTSGVFVGMQSIDFNTLATLGLAAANAPNQLSLSRFRFGLRMLTYKHIVKTVLQGDEMTRTLFSIALLASLVLLVSGASAQKNELTGILGRTFISDQGVTGIIAPDTNLHSGNGLTFEVNYGRRLMNLGIAGLTFEVPVVLNLAEDIHFDLNLVPKNYQSYFITPAIRANLFPGAGISPWVSVGGGVGHFRENSTLEFGGDNPGKTGTTSGVFQAGLGLDVRLFSRFSIRGEVRDFYSGVPQLNVDTGKTRQHNYFVGGGVVWHF